MNRSYSKLHHALCIAMLACASFSVNAAADTEVTFPDPKSTYLKTGDFIGIDHVKRITTGLTKDQVRVELGNPHFNEGIVGIRVWNYIFNFYTGNGNEYVTCQYMVKFDKDYRVESTHWKDSKCEGLLNPPVQEAKAVEEPAPAPVVVSEPEPAPVEKTPVRERVVLEADALFAFGKSTVNDLEAQGRDRLVALADKIKQDGIELTSVEVTGHTDNIGSESRNQALSEARADSVAAFLAQQGIERKLIKTNGAGESQPKVECAEHQAKKELIKCLQPNRRVEIEIVGTK